MVFFNSLLKWFIRRGSVWVSSVLLCRSRRLNLFWNGVYTLSCCGCIFLSLDHVNSRDCKVELREGGRERERRSQGARRRRNCLPDTVKGRLTVRVKTEIIVVTWPRQGRTFPTTRDREVRCDGDGTWTDSSSVGLSRPPFPTRDPFPWPPPSSARQPSLLLLFSFLSFWLVFSNPSHPHPVSHPRHRFSLSGSTHPPWLCQTQEKNKKDR